jgi:molecular chaperone GrpE
MMVKKKIFTADGEKENTQAETTENKENTTNIPEVTEITDEEGKKSEPQPDQTVSDQTKESEPDKTIGEEKALIEKLAEMQDKYLRLSAEFDNYRKRTLKEKMDIYKYAEEELLKDLLPVMDDFERALKHIEASEDSKGIREGIDLIYVKLSEFLKQHGLKEIEALNGEFNVDLHDAVAKTTVDDESRKGKIVDVILKGYYLKDKVLRHSKVVIGE